MIKYAKYESVSPLQPLTLVHLDGFESMTRLGSTVAELTRKKSM
jgi:hypothetical protein